MHEVLIRFRFMPSGKTLECFFDERLSFKDNFRLLDEITNSANENLVIYDPQKKIFLKEDIPIVYFNICSFLLLYVFDQSLESL